MSVPHIPIDRLAELGASESPTEAEAMHLRACGACEQARDRMEQMLAQVTDAVVAEADAHFPAERLTRQRARIMTQLQQRGRWINFNSHNPGRVCLVIAALSNPLLKNTINARLFVEQKTAFVRNTLSRLEQHQALRWL